MLISVLMPIYNEERTLRSIVDAVLGADIGEDIEIVCVDDGSVDRSWEILQELVETHSSVIATRHDENRGKGAAIRTAIEIASGDIAIVQDADLEYDPREIPRVIGPILDGRADAVFGSRFAASPERRVLMYWHSAGNKLLTALSNMVNDLNLTDMETCYKAVRLDLLKRMRLTTDRFGIEPEMTTRLAQWGARIYEVPISYHGRTYDEGKHIGWRDGLEALWLIFKFRFLDTEYSRTGEGSEASLGAARAYGRWVVDEMGFGPDAAVLEVGAGLGNYSRLLTRCRRLALYERNSRLAERLERRLGRSPAVSIFTGPWPPSELGCGFDAVVSFNGLATEDDPIGWLSDVGGRLREGGELHLLVPAHGAFAGPIDRTIRQRRRFDPGELRGMLAAAGYSVVEIREFNRLGAIGWRLSGTAGFTRVGSWQARLFGWFVPLAKALDRLERGRGLSLLVRAAR